MAGGSAACLAGGGDTGRGRASGVGTVGGGVAASVCRNMNVDPQYYPSTMQSESNLFDPCG